MAGASPYEREMSQKALRLLPETSDPIERLRLKCLARGATGIKGLGRSFRIMDDDRSKKLDFDEFKKGICNCGLDMEPNELTYMFQAFDEDNTGKINIDEFLVKLRPPLSISRQTVIQKAFQRADRTGDGVITTDDLRGVYNVKQHPKYLNGEWSEDQIFRKFLENFETPDDPDGVVTYDEFYDYYVGVSSSIDNDAYFDVMMRKEWQI
ncbi:calcyphosin-like protein [Clavelina lepadiformis]|uniref:calcyphosin-like protein n=1 Tax=Clavelina lepadiformis TaxID=159417 RepID=UPI004041AD62